MVDEKRKLSLWDLADMAGCSKPEGAETDGAKWLREVEFEAYDVVDSYRTEKDKEYPPDYVHEKADDLVPIYTNQLWNVWTDLGGYNFDGEYRDFSSHGDTGDRMNRIAQADCYEWAQNIIFDIVQDAGVKM
tara:strand:+ start:147 stop:542 length:396 start_codon:yes stop_codon:yes gene_type:complete